MPDPPPTTGRSPGLQRRRYPLWRLIRANLYDFGLLLRESGAALIGFGFVALVGTLYLALFYRGTPDSPRPEGLAEALYETLKLLTLQSGLRFPNGDLAGEALFFLVPLLGLALIFQSVLNFGRLLLDKGSRREAWQISLASTYRDHVIVCGLGRVSFRVASQLLAAGYHVIVIERDWSSEFVERVINLKIPVVMGDAREPATLLRAGLMRARALVASIGDDLANVEIALTARKQRPGLRVVLRIFNDDLDRNLERSFGTNSAFSASALAAPTFAAAAISREVDFVLPVGGTLLGVTQLTIEAESQVTGFTRAVEEQHHIRVLQIADSQGRPQRRSLLRPLDSGDRVTLIGPLDALETLREKNRRDSKYGFLSQQAPQHPTERFNTVIICGLGKVGYRVVRQLSRLKPRPRIVVVRLADSTSVFARRIDQLEGVTTVLGDAREREVLLKAGIEQAYSVAALTADDALNLQVALTALQLHVNVHIVLRVFSDTLADRLADMFGIRTAYSTSALAGATLAAAAAIGGVRHAFFADNTLFSSDRVTVDAGGVLEGRTIAALWEQERALVIGRRRNDVLTVLPGFDEVMAPGDTVTLLATIDDLARLRAAAERRGAARGRAARAH